MTSGLLDRIADILGRDAVVSDVAELPIVAPRDTEGVATLVAAARRHGFVVVPVGSGRDIRVRRDPRPAVALSTRRLNRVVAHEAGDLTLTVETGATLADVARTLGGSRQFLAVDARHEAATIGGSLAVARDGAFAGRCGPVRDQVLGMTVVNGDGRITKCGGRVVKNVTGYDLARLYVGSLGTLCVMTEVTLRLRPLPDIHTVLEADFPSFTDAFETGRRLRLRIADITTLHVVAGIAESPSSGARLRVGVAGLSAAVPATIERIFREVAADWSRSEVDPLPTWTEPRVGAWRLGITAPHATWSTLGPAVDALFGAPRPRIHDVLRAERILGFDAAPSDASLAALDVLTATSDARVGLLDDPSFEGSLASRFPAQLPDGVDLMRGLRRTLDPDGVLSPRSTLAD